MADNDSVITTPQAYDPKPLKDAEKIRFLFRFRDMIAKTIIEHRKVISQNGACLWGWWMRPHEDEHKDVWDQLERDASPESPVRIGLFDSGHDKVYAAEVIGVIRPTLDHFGNLSQVQLTEEDKKLVPEYYRNSYFSRAWLRLRYIAPNELGDFFGNYSFDGAPPLRNFSEKVLQELQHKVIVNADELIGMNTTIWRVRAAREGDSRHEIRLTTPSLGSPISFDSVDAESDTILHITDPHFTVGKRRSQHVWRLEGESGESVRKSLAEAILSAIKLSGKKIGLVIVTGDLTFANTKEEYDEAAKSLRKLLRELTLDIDHLVVIPGNHDIKWATENEYTTEDKVEEAPPEAKIQYENFYSELFGHKPNVHLSMGRRFLMPCGISLEICAVNSSTFKWGKKFLDGLGYVHEGAINEIASGFGWNSTRTMALRILALHHHLVLTEDTEPAQEYGRGFGIISNAAGILRMAARYGIQLALHGHKHRAFVWQSNIYELPERAQKHWHYGNMSILGGGSAGSSSTDGGKNYFNLIEVSSEQLSLDIYQADNQLAVNQPASLGEFKSIQSWTADFRLEGNPVKLTLKEWVNLSDSNQ